MFISNCSLLDTVTAFKKLGLDCANWTEPVYLDLLRCDIKVMSNFFSNMLHLFFEKLSIFLINGKLLKLKSGLALGEL